MTTNGDCDFDHIYDVSPWIRNDVFEGIDANKKLKNPRIIKSHDQYKDFDPQVCGKIIFVIRDGLDAMYSLYKQKVAYGKPDLKLEDFSKKLITDDKTKWYNFNKHWLMNSKKKDMLFLTYNEIVNDKKETVHKICSFLNLDIKAIDIERVIEKSSMKFMKKNETLFGERVSKDHHNFDYTKFIRKGGFGEGDKKLNQTIKKLYKKELQKLEPLLKKYNLKL